MIWTICHRSLFHLCLLLSVLIHPSIGLAADIIWSESIIITGDADVLTIGELDRAYNFGATKRETVVNDVNFIALGTANDLQGGTESLSDGRTALIGSADGDGFSADVNPASLPLPQISAEYASLIQSKIANRGYPAAVILNGLTVGKTYLLQSWAHDSRATPAALRLATRSSVSPPLKVNSTEMAAGLGSHIVGIFTADDTKQVVTFTPIEGSAQLCALQLRTLPGHFEATVLKQPDSATNFLSKSITLKIVALSDRPLSYQWQKITGDSTNDLADDGRIIGAKASSLQIQSLRPGDEASYQVIVRSSSTVTSDLAYVTVLEPRTNQLINVAVVDGVTAPFSGKAVLDAAPQEVVWNNLDARRSFANVALMDAAGAPTRVSLSLVKSDGWSVRQDALRCVSFAAQQVVTISNLAPNELYDVVVFSVGNMPNEGGVFSGGIEGICYGYPVANTSTKAFLFETNYLQNPYALSDAQGTITFTIKPNSTAFAGGHTFGDFNGLQLTRTSAGRPAILRSPQSLKSNPGESATLSVHSASPPSEPITFRWQKSDLDSSSSRGNEAHSESRKVGAGQAETPEAWMDLTETQNLTGMTNSSLVLRHLTAADAGNYRVLVSNRYGSTTSEVAVVSILTNQLFNVAITEGSLPLRSGTALLDGTSRDVWNSLDGRKGFIGAPLADAQGKITSVTLSLSKTDGGAVRNGLLGAVSFGTHQTITISNLPGYESFHLAVFSVGNMPNEGGVISGAVNGICRGYPDPKAAANEFLSGTNCLFEPYVMSDFKGTITFSVAANSTAFSGGHTFGDFNGLQLMQVPPGPPAILQQPTSISAIAGSPVRLEVKAKGPPSSGVSYRWQKISSGRTNDLADTSNVSGATNAALTFRSLTAANNGLYRVVVSSRFGFAASQVVTVSAVQNQLINVAINNGSTPPYVGRAVLDGSPNDVWNSPDGRKAFANLPLVDAAGMPTPITLSLSKSDGNAMRQSLLGGVSFAKNQTITLNNLLPNESYHLVVFSIGNMANEGGVFSGAVEGICRGYPAANTIAKGFVLQTNYLENLNAMSDAQGTITFTVAPNSTAFPGGHTFGDFNGLQLKKNSR